MADAGTRLVADKRAWFKFDDQVILFDSSAGGKGASGGFVYAGGLIDTNLYLETLNSQEGTSQPVPPNLRDCRFNICPKLQYAAQRALERSHDNAGKVSGNSMAQKEEAAHLEDTNNMNEFMRMAGEPVFYGITVQLRHTASGKFLTLMRSRANVDTTALKLEVVEGGEENSWWKIMPAYKSKKEGDKVMPNDIVIFVSEKVEKTCVCVSRSEVNASGLHEYVQKRLEVNANADGSKLKMIPCAQTPVVMDLDTTKPKAVDSLKGGDSITFFHRETESYLMFDKDLGKAPFFKYTVPSQRNDSTMDSNGLWKVESEVVEWEGDLVPWAVKGAGSTRYRVKHLASNMYLGLDSQSSQAFSPASPIGPSRPTTAATDLQKLNEADPNAPRTANGLKLRMTTDYCDPAVCTIWTFHPFEKEFGPVITFESLLFLQNENLARLPTLPPSWLSHSGRPCAIRESDMASETAAQSQISNLRVDIEKGGDKRSFGSAASRVGSGMSSPFDKLSAAVDGVVMQSKGIVVDTFHCDLLAEQDTRDAMDLDLVPEELVVQLIHARNSIAKLRTYQEELHLVDPIDNELPVKEIGEWLKTSQLRLVVMKHQTTVQNVLTSMILACTDDDNLDPLTREGTARPTQQRLFFEQGAIRVVVAILNETFIGKAVPRWVVEQRSLGVAFVKMGQLAFRFLRQVVQDNPANKKVMERHTALLLSQLGSEMKTANVLTELYKSNLELLKKVDESEIMKYINLLNASPWPRFLNFLSVLCVSNGVPIPENQRKVVDLLIIRNPHLLVTARIEKSDGGRPKEVWLSHADGTTFALSTLTASEDKFMVKDTAIMTQNELRMAYYLKVLDVYHDVSVGRNRGGIDVLIEKSELLGITYANMVDLISMDNIPMRVRQSAVKLMMCLYVDREPQEPMTIVKLVRIWQPVRPVQVPERTKVNPYSKFLKFRPTDGFPELLKLILSFFNDVQGRLSGSSQVGTEEYKLMQNMLNMCVMLMNFGFYHLPGEGSTSDLDKQADFSAIKDLVHALLPVLRADVPFQNKSSAMSRSSSSASAGSGGRKGGPGGGGGGSFSAGFATAMEVKIQICRVLEMGFDCRMDRRMSMLLAEYERVFLHQFPDISVLAAHVEGIKGVPPPSISGGKHQVVRVSQKKVGPSPAVRSQVLTQTYPFLNGDSELSEMWAKEHFKELQESMFARPIIGPEVMASSDIFSPPNIVQILLKCVNFEYPRLTSVSFSLLNRHMTQKAALIKRCRDVQILVYPEVVRMFYDVHVDVSEVRRQTKWLGSDDPESKKNAYEQIRLVLEKMKGLCTLGARVTVAGKTIRVDEEMVPKSQNILRNLNAHSYVIAILKGSIDRRPQVTKDNGPSLDSTNDTEKRDLYNLAYSMLARFADKNDANQRLLYTYLNDKSCFLFHMGIQGLNVAAAISSIFSSNQKLCDKVEEGVITRMFELLTKHGKQARWLTVLARLVVVDNKPNKRNQDLVLKAIVNFQTSVMDFSNTPAQHNRRLELMVSRESDAEMGSELKYHAACISLLADCCKGSNPGAEVKVRSMMSLDLLMRAILDSCYPLLPDGARGPKEAVDPDVQNLIRSAHVQFLHEVYMDSRTETVLNSLRHEHNRFWDCDRESYPDWETRFGDEWLIPTMAKELLQLEAALDDGGAHDHDLLDESDSDSDGPGAAVRLSRKLNRSAAAKQGASTADAELEKYVCEAVVPMLAQYYESVYLSSAADRVQQDSHCELITSATSLVNLVMNDTSQANLFHLLTQLGAKESAMADAADSGGDGGMGVDPDALELLEPLETLGDLFKAGYPEFFASVALKLGIKDVEKPIGPGFRDMCEMLSINGPVPGAEISGSPVHFRRTLQNLCSLAQEAQPPDGMPHALILDTLRCCLHMEDPHVHHRGTHPLNDSWERFLKGEDPEKTEPADGVLTFVQVKYNELGATEAGIVGLSNVDQGVQLAASRLLLALLSNGNKAVQDTIFASVSRSRNEGFVLALRNGIKSGKELTKEYEKIRVELERQNLMAVLTARLSMRKSNRSGARVSAGAMMTQRNTAAKTMRAGVSADGRCVDVATDSFFMDSVKLVEYMTEGHHANLQAYMSSQPINKRSHNLMAEIVGVMEELVPACNIALDNLDDCMVQMSIQCSKSLAEATQGPCAPNQDFLTSSSLLITVDRFFAANAYMDPDEGFDSDSRSFKAENYVNGYGEKEKPDPSERRTTFDVKLELNRSLLVAMHSLLEACNTPEKPQRMLSMLTPYVLRDHMVRIFELLFLKGKAPKKNEFSPVWQVWHCFEESEREEGLLEELFSIFFLLRFISDYDRSDGPVNKVLAEMQDMSPGLSDYMDDNVGSIEVLRGRELERVYFKQPDDIIRFKKSASFFEQADGDLVACPRSNPQEKAEGFLRNIKRLQIKCHQRSIIEASSLFFWTIKAQRLVENYALVTSLVVTLYTLFAYGTKTEPWQAGIDALGEWGNFWCMTLLRVTHLITSTLLCIIYFRVKAPLSVAYMRLDSEIDERKERRLEMRHSGGHDEGEVDDDDDGESAVISPWLNFDGDDSALEPPAEEFPAGQLAAACAWMKDLFFYNVLPYYYIVYLFGSAWGLWDGNFNEATRLDCASTMGTCLNNMGVFIYAAHLLDVFNMPVGQLVLQSLVAGGPGLLSSSFVTLLIVIIMGTVGFVYFQEDVPKCGTYFECIMYHIIVGLSSGDSLREVFGNTDYGASIPEGMTEIATDWTQTKATLRTLWVFAFFIVWVIVLQGIIMGQIVDAFTSLRDEKESDLADLDENCFVCSQGRLSFEKVGGFINHIEREHDRWSYLSFANVLDSKDTMDYNGLESHIANQFEEDIADFLPIGRSMSLDLVEGLTPDPVENLGDRMDVQMEALKTDLFTVNTRLNKVDDTLERLVTMVEKLKR